MILSFELLGDEHVEIVFDDEARRELIRLLSETEIPGDHFHLFLGEMGGGFGKITEPFNKWSPQRRPLLQILISFNNQRQRPQVHARSKERRQRPISDP